jgi:coenzyme F420-reducing hydrogenase alpha subunit
MARYSLNFDRLPALVQQAARDANLAPVCRNPFQSIVIRAVEVLYAVDEALRIIAAYERPEHAAVCAAAAEGTGVGCTEAPRGILFHRYRVHADGTIGDAKIVPPTSQNQKAIENDLQRFVERHLQLSNEELTWKCEQAVRNYDPCISCATHFLKLQLDHE